MKVVDFTDDVMLISSDGTVIRMKTSEISTIGRLTKGVRLMRMADGVNVVSIAITAEQEETDEEILEGEEATTENTETTEE